MSGQEGAVESLEYGAEDYRRWAALFNDITFAPTEQFVHFGTRRILTDYLWAQGWRRDVRPEDVTERTADARTDHTDSEGES